jgi:hypothetical protein
MKILQFWHYSKLQSTNQFRKSQRCFTTAGFVELRWNLNTKNLTPILIPHLTEFKWVFSAAADVCGQSVECDEGVGWSDNTKIPTALSYLIDTVCPRNVWKDYLWITWQTTSFLRLFTFSFIFSFRFFLFGKMYSYLFAQVTIQMLQLTIHSVRWIAQWYK